MSNVGGFGGCHTQRNMRDMRDMRNMQFCEARGSPAAGSAVDQAAYRRGANQRTLNLLRWERQKLNSGYSGE